jgi:hypothetical protein
MMNSRTGSEKKPFVTTGEFAKRAGVSANLVRTLIARGELPTHPGLGKRARIRQTSPTRERNRIMTVSPLLETLELPISDPRFSSIRVPTVLEETATVSVNPRDRLIGAGLTVLVLVGFLVSLWWLA